MPENTLFTYWTALSPSQTFPDDSKWNAGEPAVIDRYWNGTSALQEKGYNWNNLTEVLSLWDSESIYFRFHCWYENLDPSSGDPEDRAFANAPDIIELFLRLPGCEDYFEITVTPQGNWRDLHIRVPHLRIDPEWTSGLSLDSRINKNERIWKGILRLPYSQLAVDGTAAAIPRSGDVWRVSFGRVVGKEPEIEYLSWRPTFTSWPDFHIPHSFGNLIFMEG